MKKWNQWLAAVAVMGAGLLAMPVIGALQSPSPDAGPAPMMTQDNSPSTIPPTMTTGVLPAKTVKKPVVHSTKTKTVSKNLKKKTVSVKGKKTSKTVKTSKTLKPAKTTKTVKTAKTKSKTPPKKWHHPQLHTDGK